MIANEWRYVDLQSWQTQYLAIIFSHGLARPLSSTFRSPTSNHASITRPTPKLKGN
jgi:hypothetical protein